MDPLFLGIYPSLEISPAILHRISSKMSTRNPSRILSDIVLENLPGMPALLGFFQTFLLKHLKRDFATDFSRNSPDKFLQRFSQGFPQEFPLGFMQKFIQGFFLELCILTIPLVTVVEIPPVVYSWKSPEM